jgi:DNA-binding GntR family transcriptional regulator
MKHMLVSGQFAPDEWFPIDKIAAELKISRQPVMDAIRRLSIEGFVEVVPQVGCRARKPEISEIRDFFKLFAEGEALVAELAATRADPQNVLSLRLISSQIGMLAKQKDVENSDDLYRTLNRQLHAEMRRAARSPSLAEIVESLGDRSDFFIACAKGRVFSPNLAIAHTEHEEIIEAIAQGNGRKARSAMKNHIAATERRLELTLR